MTDEPDADDRSIDVEPVDTPDDESHDYKEDAEAGENPEPKDPDEFARSGDRSDFIESVEAMRGDFDDIHDEELVAETDGSRLVGYATVLVYLDEEKGVSNVTGKTLDPSLRTQQAVSAVNSFNEGHVENAFDIGLRDQIDEQSGPVAGAVSLGDLLGGEGGPL